MIRKLTTRFLSKEMEFYNNSVAKFFERDLEKDIQIFQNQRPRDDFGRSIAQHRCQVYPFKKDVLLFNLISFLLIPFALAAMLLKRRVPVRDVQTTMVCYNCSNFPGSLPEALFDKEKIYLHTSECPYYLRKKDISFLLRFFIRSFRHPFLAFRVMSKVAKYRALIDSFSKLEVIAVTGEFEDTSSALTQYCHENGIKHYDFMQGEAFGSPRASFFHFDRCFVWDQHYVNLFVGYGACPEQFEVSLPQCLQKIDGNHNEKSIDYTYYLGGDPDEDLTIIRTVLDKLVEKGYVCVVRPHPKWSNMETVKKVFEGVTVQDTGTISIEQSIMKTRNAVSLYSTVLLQSYYNDVNVVIDDLSNPDKFRMLECYQYIMLNKSHQLLSEITNS